MSPVTSETGALDVLLEKALTPAAVGAVLESAGAGLGPGFLPSLARDPVLTSEIRSFLPVLGTEHRLVLGDSRNIRFPPSSIHLVVTSPPYWNLKEYPKRGGQLGGVDDYEVFLRDLREVWSNCYDALVPGGRLVCVVGDVCLSRRRNGGRHMVVPLHSDIQAQCREIGFDNLAPVVWYKISNLRTEVTGRGGSYLGKPYEPNGIIKNDVEFILMLRKPGGYRSPSPKARVLSVISQEDHALWFRQVWDDIPGASVRNHPAPFPRGLADRLVRMFSFVGGYGPGPICRDGLNHVRGPELRSEQYRRRG